VMQFDDIEVKVREATSSDRSAHRYSTHHRLPEPGPVRPLLHVQGTSQTPDARPGEESGKQRTLLANRTDAH
jgi:hypothetical protein